MGAAVRVDRNLGAIWRKYLGLIKEIHLDNWDRIFTFTFMYDICIKWVFVG